MNDIMSSLPWVLGSLGTVSLDSVILVQAMIYARGRGGGTRSLSGGGSTGDTGSTTYSSTHRDRHDGVLNRVVVVGNEHCDDEGQPLLVSP